MTKQEIDELVLRARTTVLVPQGIRFDNPNRIQRMADVIVDLANELEQIGARLGPTVGTKSKGLYGKK